MPDGTEVTYQSQSEAARVVELDQSQISKLCRGERTVTLGGIKARFADDAPSVVE